MKYEIKKLLTSTAFCIIFTFWYNSNHGTVPFLDILKDIFDYLFSWPPYYLVFIILFYISFNIIYFISFLIQRKIFKRRFTLLGTTSIISTLILLLIVVNREYLYQNFKDFSLSHIGSQNQFFVKNENGKVDSTNYKKFIWEKKYYYSTIPTLFIKEYLKFESDSLAILSGWMTHHDVCLMFRDIFGLYEKKYQLSYSAKDDTLFFKNGKANFKSDYEEMKLIEIDADRLYLKSILVDSMIYIREIGE
jgi:hypothetical protein